MPNVWNNVGQSDLTIPTYNNSMTRNLLSDQEETPKTVSQCMEDEDPSRDRYPFCVVWTGLPLITSCLPFIGHLGIGDSQGRIWDFPGPYSIGV